MPSGWRHLPTLTMADYGIPANAAPPPPPDRSSFAAYRASEFRSHGAEFREAKLRQMFEANPDGSVGAIRPPKRIRDAVLAGRAKPEYAKIQVPVVALFAIGGSQTADYTAMRIRHRDDLRRSVPQARIVEVPGGNFYLFLSHPDVVAREIRALSASPVEQER